MANGYSAKGAGVVVDEFSLLNLNKIDNLLK